MRDLSSEWAALERDGQVVVRRLLDQADVARFRTIVNRALPTACKVELPPGKETYQAAFDRYMNLWRSDDAVRTITMWLPLHDVDPTMGDLEFAVGTHRGPIGDESISDGSDAFCDAGARVIEPRNKGQQLDRMIWLRNIGPGELAASDLDPLVGAP